MFCAKNSVNSIDLLRVEMEMRLVRHCVFRIRIDMDYKHEKDRIVTLCMTQLPMLQMEVYESSEEILFAVGSNQMNLDFVEDDRGIIHTNIIHGMLVFAALTCMMESASSASSVSRARV